MALKTFRFEIPTKTRGIVVVDAVPTRHPMLVVSQTVEGDKWVVTHGPTGRSIKVLPTIEEALQLSDAIADEDPTGELLVIDDPGDLIYAVPKEQIPIPMWDAVMAAFKKVGLPTEPHPLTTITKH